MPDLLNETTRKARKKHRCELCSGEILIGEKYICQSVKDSGEIYTFKMHICCKKLISQLEMDLYDSGIAEDSFADYLQEYLDCEIPVWYKAKMVSEFIRIMSKNKYCIWKLHKYSYKYYSGCGGIETFDKIVVFDIKFKYCPYCGKEIKIDD